MGANSVSYGATNSALLDKLTNTQRVGRANFWSANASVVLNETNNRFSPTYAPIMDRLLRGECTTADLNSINARVLNSPVRLQDGSMGKLNMKDCWNAQTITFRNKVNKHGTDCSFLRFCTPSNIEHLPTPSVCFNIA